MNTYIVAMNIAYGIGFTSCSEFSLPDTSVEKSIINFGVEMSSSVHIDNKEKYILIFDLGPTKRSDNTTLTAE